MSKKEEAVDSTLRKMGLHDEMRELRLEIIALESELK